MQALQTEGIGAAANNTSKGQHSDKLILSGFGF